MASTGIQALLDLLAEFGVAYIFGNPGSTELPLNDALIEDTRIDYLLGLHEIPVMAMADGYAMASRSIAVVNLHSSCGLGNAMGMLYNAMQEGTPLLVTAGQQDCRLQLEEPVLLGDNVSVARPWTKHAIEVNRVEDVPAALRQAVQVALTPPTGPVFLSLPLDVQSGVAKDLDMSPIVVPDCRTRPPVEAICRAVEVLAQAERPVILAGGRVAEMDAVESLVSVAETLGAPVYSECATTHGRLGFPPNHPLYGQSLPLWAPDVRERLAEFDVVLAVGLNLLRQYFYFEPNRAIPSGARIVHFDVDPRQIGKNYMTEVGVVGHLRCSLDDLRSQLDQVAFEESRIVARRACWEATHAVQRQQLRAEIAAQRDQRPMTPLTLMATIGDVLPGDAAVIEEAVTTTGTVLERLGAIKQPNGYFGHRGWALGWGLGCALGVKLAWPHRPVLALLGDGASLYGIQGLWTAARYRIPVTFVICNNAQYKILKDCGQGLRLPHASQNRFLGCDLTGPEVDFVALSQSLGVDAVRVTEPDELRYQLLAGFSGDKPLLLDVPIARDRPGD